LRRGKGKACMLKQRARLVARSLRAGDMAMLGLAFPVAYYLRDHVVSSLGSSVPGLYPISSYWPLLASSLLVWLLASWIAGLYGVYRTVGIGTEVLRLARTFAILAVVIAAGQFVWKNHELSRLFFGLYYASAFALLLANRVTVRVLAHAARRRGFNTRTFAVVGLGEMVEGVVEAISAHREWGYLFAGYIVEDGAQRPPGVKVLGRLSQMGEILETHVLDEVIFGVPREKLEDIEQAVLLCEEQGVRVKVLLNFFPNRSSHMEVEDLEGLPLLTFSSTPTEAAPLVAKRVFDVAVSATLLTLLSPLFAAIALAIKLETSGPVLFRQRRIGQNGREFWLYKFRSMCADAEARVSQLRRHNEMDGPVFKMRKDPRVTRVGRFLRRTSLDEFPQFWNVFKGEMSVVGPRPPLPSEVRLYQRWQRRRLSVKPGITCIWQISGRNEIDFAEWMALDLHYIDNWSLWGDVKIVLQTIPAVLWGRGAR
jgi:exopolysaccharide biosynthesis polyprenyl glycosylphosphotransferase